MELKTYTPVVPKLVFEKIKFKVLHYIQRDFIHQHPRLNKDQTSMIKSFVINYFILKYGHTCQWLYCIKSKKYFVLLKLNYLQSRLDTIYKDHIYHNKQTKTFYRKIKFDLLNFRGGQKWVTSSFDGFFSFFFMKWQCQYKVLCLINCNHEKSTFFKDRHYFIYFYSFSSLAISLPDKDFQNAYCLIIKP